ncbi:MAG: preprotein translocase subunit SecE [Clostridiaceae bacterium]|nr:preprotein translocase subunit SecE [Clostridiaceae bacterium]
MAEEVKVSKGASTKEKALNTKNNFVRFFKDIKSELKRVVWPSKNQLINNTVTVLMACLFVGAFIWLVDAGLQALMNIVYKV